MSIKKRTFAKAVNVTASTAVNVADLMATWGGTAGMEGAFLEIGAISADTYFGHAATVDNTNGIKIASGTTRYMVGYTAPVDPSAYWIWTTGSKVEINYLCR